LNFYDHVLLRTYGDDLLATVKEDIAPYFNCNYYQTACQEHFHMIFTAADKSLVVRDFMSWDEVSFLRRNFVPHPNGRIVAPLLSSTIHKMLEMYIPSRTESFEDQLASSLQSAMQELFLHIHDEHAFSELRESILRLVAETTYVVREDAEECLIRLRQLVPCYTEIYQRIFFTDEIGHKEDSQ